MSRLKVKPTISGSFRKEIDFPENGREHCEIECAEPRLTAHRQGGRGVTVKAGLGAERDNERVSR